MERRILRPPSLSYQALEFLLIAFYPDLIACSSAFRFQESENESGELRVSHPWYYLGIDSVRPLRFSEGCDQVENTVL